jgi:leader peptidase (prepilin peptidase)/N-methyltransferase
MILWVLAYLKFGISLYTFLVIIFFSLLIILSMIDIDIKEIPNALIIALVVIGLIDFANTGRLIWWEKLAGGGGMFLIFAIIGILTGGLGGGDVKLVGAAGLFLGWKLILMGTLIGIFIGAAIGVVLLITKKAGRKSEMPFGPSLAAGFVFAILIGPEILNWYIGLFS